MDKELSDSLDKVIGVVGVGYFDVVGVDSVDDVDAEGSVIAINSLSPCIDVVGVDGVFEGDFFIASQSTHYFFWIPSYINIWLQDVSLLFCIDHNTK